MMKVLEQLWNGAIRPCERAVRPGSEYARLQDAAQKEYDRFWELLSPDAKEAYSAFSETNITLMSISDQDFFLKGFRLGAQLVLAAITEYDTQLPALTDE